MGRVRFSCVIYRIVSVGVASTNKRPDIEQVVRPHYDGVVCILNQ
ncbi:hypothetical protein GCWU000325_01831 [Alloprevotella tannerae ATCC 51259]|uniref:Uncharacterized protein n=1 Tax=Alloprevotella tannerae ATCC 51259 TaxID=626522 RepID=C9LHX8_9BACT|nr:hypothetical protein GCWU000325_01831 [Alloprevotella tannerae ATCC 51259]